MQRTFSTETGGAACERPSQGFLSGLPRFHGTRAVVVDESVAHAQIAERLDGAGALPMINVH